MKSGYQRQLFALPPAHPAPKYVYRAKYYDNPPADWPAPKEACWQCQKQQWAPSWKWNGYEWTCTRKHE